jgi:hypothetical protein
MEEKNVAFRIYTKVRCSVTPGRREVPPPF